MIMLAAFNAYERELEDWQRILKDADPRFGCIKYTQQIGALLGVLEVEWLGDDLQCKEQPHMHDTDRSR